MSTQATDLITRYFEAMQAGADAEDDLMELFAPDAVYSTPFGTEPVTVSGRDAIRSTFRASWENPPPDLDVIVQRIEVDGERVTSHWTCTSPAFPGPVHGSDRYVVRDGLIAELHVTLKGDD